jgi:transglutaminase-like putative cysteine protease
MTPRDTWLLSVTHRSGYRYGTPVLSSYNEARLTPRTDPHQRVLDATVEVTPAAALFRYVDYFGSVVTAFDLHTPHTELVVTAGCVVETAPANGAEPDGAWQAIEAPDIRDELGEYLTWTDRTAPGNERSRSRPPASGRCPTPNTLPGKLPHGYTSGSIMFLARPASRPAQPRPSPRVAASAKTSRTRRSRSCVPPGFPLATSPATCTRHLKRGSEKP